MTDQLRRSALSALPGRASSAAEAGAGARAHAGVSSDASRRLRPLITQLSLSRSVLVGRSSRAHDVASGSVIARLEQI